MARCPVRRNVHANMHGQSTSVALCTCPAALFASNVCLLPSACMCIQKFSYIQMFSYIQKFSYIQMISFDTVAHLANQGCRRMISPEAKATLGSELL